MELLSYTKNVPIIYLLSNQIFILKRMGLLSYFDTAVVRL